MNVLLGVTGSVAAIKIPALIEAIQKLSPLINLRLVCTQTSLKFLRDYRLGSLVLYTDEDEWQTWSKLGDCILHIELRTWADFILIAPLDANTLAKISHGLCDNLLTNVIRASNPLSPKCPKILIAPAMNTEMWTHPCTIKQLETLESWKMLVIPPIEKLLACGDYGTGAMASVEEIVERLRQVMFINNAN